LSAGWHPGRFWLIGIAAAAGLAGPVLAQQWPSGENRSNADKPATAQQTLESWMNSPEMTRQRSQRTGGNETSPNGPRSATTVQPVTLLPLEPASTPARDTAPPVRNNARSGRALSAANGPAAVRISTPASPHAAPKNSRVRIEPVASTPRSSVPVRPLAAAAETTTREPTATVAGSNDCCAVQATPYENCCSASPHDWTYRLLPEGLLYRSYLAGEKEPRMSAVWLNSTERGLIWETSIGARVGLLRYGTQDDVQPISAWQMDLEGAAFTRVDPEQESDLEAADFRVGLISTWRRGPMAWKFGYYHISSHVGDEFLLANPGFPRRNYVRDSAILGVSRDVTCDCRIYGEVGYAAGTSGGAEPLEFQFGGEYNPIAAKCARGAPFAAVNAHLREEFEFGGGLNAVAGWQWRGDYSDRLLRVGMQYYRGKALQYSFFDLHEELLGAGLWFDY